MTSSPTTLSAVDDDRGLLRLYVRRRDETAFAELVRRYGPLVHGVCRRVLRSTHDVEDAFQGTFLVLARDAHRIVRQRSLASWLHGVAYRTSLRAAESRHRRIRLLQDVTMIEDSTLADVELRHERQKLDEELAGLPEKYRTPLVLHYLEGRSNADIAKLLGLSVSNVEGRLRRGRKELKLRLTRRGIGLSAALAAVHWSQSLTAATPLETLVGPAIEAGLSYTSGDPAGPLFTHEAARLAGQELMTMSATTTTAATLTALVLLPMVAFFSGHDGDSQPPPGGGAGAISTVLAEPQDDAAADAIAVTQASSRNAEVSFLVKDGKVFRQTLEELGDVGDSGISVTGMPEGAGIDVMSEDGSFEEMYSDVMGEMMAGATGGDAATPAPSARFDIRTANPQEERIEAALDDETEFAFVDMPLHEAIEFIADRHKLTILIDEFALNDIGLPTDEPVNLVLSGVSLRSALKILLSQWGLDTLIDDEVLKVTSSEKADAHREMRVYDVSRLAHIPPETLVQIIETSIPGATWVTIDGIGGTVTPFDGGLVVTQTQRTHHKIIELLELLARQAAATPRASATYLRGSSSSGATAGLSGSAASEGGTSTAGQASSGTPPPAESDRPQAEGRITLDGQPVSQGRIEFYTERSIFRSGSLAAVATTDDRGYYKTETDNEPGLKPGLYAVEIKGSPSGAAIPARYNTQSSITIAISAGNNILNFDLTSDPETPKPVQGATGSPGAVLGLSGSAASGDRPSTAGPASSATSPAGQPATPRAHVSKPAHVTGTVTLDGKPLANARVEFIQPGVVIATDVTDAEGRYQMMSEGVSGSPAGVFEVTINRTRLTGPAIPSRYNSQTTLQVTVKPGPNVFDFELTSED